MSKIGKKNIRVTGDTTVNLVSNNITVSGVYGTLSATLSSDINVALDNQVITVIAKKKTKKASQLWGSTRSIIYNMLVGVSKKFHVKLKLHGTGYKASIQDEMLFVVAGYSHTIAYCIPKTVTVNCYKNNDIIISGCNKQLVGQIAANIHAIRKPDLYKGKGIRYQEKILRLKEGKKR